MVRTRSQLARPEGCAVRRLACPPRVPPRRGPPRPWRSRRRDSLAAGEPREVGVDHHPHEFLEGRPAGFQPSSLARLRRVAEQLIDLGRPLERSSCLTYCSQSRPTCVERDLDALPDRVHLAGRDHVIVRLVGAAASATSRARSRRRSPSRGARRGCRAAARREPELDARRAVRDLARHELEPAARRFVVEEDARDREQVVALAVVDRDEVAVRLRDPVRAARVERRRLSFCGTSRTLPNISRRATPGRSGSPGRRGGSTRAPGSRRRP